MRLTKKLLATLLPVAATASVAPILTSCNGDPYNITFASSVNCLNKDLKDVKYHSLDEVKNSMKIHAPRYQQSTIASANLPKVWTESSNLEKQELYYDFIASHSLLNPVEFLLIWGDTSVDFTAKGKDKVTAAPGTLCYQINTDKTINICFGTISTRSYKFQNARVQG